VTEEIFECSKKLKKNIDVEYSRKFLNILVSGHRPSRLPMDEVKQQKIKNTFQAILDRINKNCQDNKKILRILAGNSDGVDQWAYELNKEYFKAPFFRIAPFKNNNSESLDYIHNVYISDQPFSPPIPETWIKATDEVKLDYADLMIAIWDGQPPRGSMGGVVRLLIDALRRHIPIILVDTSPEALGTILVSQTDMIDSSQHCRLRIEESNFSWVKSELFQKKTIDELSSFFSRKLEVESSLLRKFYNNSQRLDPMQKATVSGVFFDIFMWRFRKKWKKIVAPIRVYRGKPHSFLEKTLQEGFWRYFDMFDRTATHAANKYRDKVIAIHLLASFAVLGAVAGSIAQSDITEMIWGFLELASLGMILFLLHERKKKTNSHDVWLSFRQAAEAFRINVFLRPQLSSLPQLHESIWSETREMEESAAPSSERPPQKKISLVDPSLWVVTQLFHEAGPPCAHNHDSNSCKGYILTKNRQELIVQMRELIEDQKSYHDGNQEQNLKVHERIEMITVVAFYFIVIVVSFHLVGSFILSGMGEYSPFARILSWVEEHFLLALSDLRIFIHSRYIIIITAFFPAFVAAFHDIHSQLELNRVAKNSHQMSERLGALLKTLDNLDESNNVKSNEDPIVLRNLARELAQTLYQEHDAWGKLMKDQHLDVPA